MHLSKSKYCNAVQCKKMLWLNEYKSEEKEEIDNSAILYNGILVGEVARDLFIPHEDVEYNENLNQMLIDTKELMKEENINIAEASFVYKNNFCSVDILVKKKENIEIYEVKSSTAIKDIYLDDISYQGYILKNLGYKVTKASLVYINNKYKRKGKLELDKLFVIEDVTDIVNDKQEEIENYIKEIEKCMENKDEPDIDIDIHCVKPYDCPFFKYCTRHLPEHNVFDIRGLRNADKFRLYHEGIYSYKDLLNTYINSKYKRQIEFTLYNKKAMIDKNRIIEFLNTLSYPLYFLDFETFQQAIPEYDDVTPYMQIPFQYSLHYIEEENKELKHKEFLSEAGIDPRRCLAESLVKDIPKDVCVLAYNMSFEKRVIKALAEIYPDLKSHLLNIHDNIKDLMIPFSKGYYYKKEMEGSYSIKYVLPALFPNEEELNYNNLDMIHNGSEAMSTFANLKNLEKDEQEKVRENLLKYCKLDTYAMVKIWQKLNEVVK